MKKSYQQPKTISSMMEPRTILCASVGNGFIGTNDNPVTGVPGD